MPTSRTRDHANRRRKPATIRDVARAAGVSPSTVSKVLNGRKAFPEETRERVTQAAQRVGYLPSPHAQTMVTGRTWVLGVKILDITNPYFANIVKGAQERAFDEGYSLIVADSQEDPDTEIHTIQELAKRSDGLIIAGSRLPEDRLRDLPARPTVVVGRAVPDSPFVCIHHPFEERLTLAVRHLVDLGHRRIVTVLPRAVQPRTDVLEPFRREGCRFFPLPIAGPDIASGEAAAAEVFDLPARPTAAVAYNDLVAYGILRAARQRGVRIPDQLSLIGSDDLIFDEIVEPPLTSVSGDQREVGGVAVRILAEWARGEKVEPHVITMPSRLVVRASTGPPDGGTLP